MPYHVLYARAPGDADVRASPGAYRLLIRTHGPGKRQAFVLAQKRVAAKKNGVGIVRVSHSQMADQEAYSNFYGAQAPNLPKEEEMSQHTAPMKEWMDQENLEALKAVEALEKKVEPKLSTSLDPGNLNVSARIVNLIKDAGYKTLEAAREAGEDLLNIKGVGTKTLEKIQGVEAELPEVEEPIEVVEHEPQKADEAPKGDPIGLPEVSKEAAKALRKLNVHFKKTPEGRVRTTAGFFVLAPPEHLAQKGVGKNFVRSYNPNGWHGWAVSGWSPKRK